MPWSNAEQLASISKGEYTRIVKITQPGSEPAVITEWVTFDLADKFIDRRIGLETETGAIPTREEPSLRFLYMGRSVLMWNPNADVPCGTPWVEMSAKQLEKMTGLSVAAGDLLTVEPLEILRESEPPSDALENDNEGTVYEIEVSGLAGIPISSYLLKNPGMTRKLSRQKQTARVRIPRGGGPLEIEIDLAEVLEAVEPDVVAGGEASVLWHLRPLSEVTPPEPPKDVATSSCLDGG